jgi:acetoin utilization protein AcuC
MSDPTLAFVYPPEIERLSYPPDCPFKTARATLTRDRLKSFGLLKGKGRMEVAPEKASRSDLEQYHSSRYLDELERAAGGDLSVEGLGMGIGGPDTPVFKDMLEYGAWACGAALKAADLLFEKKAEVAFHLCGGLHHAGAEKASGFCYVNDMVLACMRLANAGERVLYLDLDAHHGDGVQSAFYARNDVLTISLHESGKTLFPGTGFEDEIGAGAGTGYSVNVPLPAETHDEAFLRALDQVAVPLMEAFLPGAIVLELGMDILAGDPLTHLRMTNNVVPEVMERLLRRRIPLLVAGGGGYHVENTVRGWALAWRTCCGEEREDGFNFGMGGVMMGSSEWAGGLQDRALPVTPIQRRRVDEELQATIETITRTVFPVHGIRACPAWRVTAPGRFC